MAEVETGEKALPRGAVGKCPDGRAVYARKGESAANAVKRVCG